MMNLNPFPAVNFKTSSVPHSVKRHLFALALTAFAFAPFAHAEVLPADGYKLFGAAPTEVVHVNADNAESLKTLAELATDARKSVVFDSPTVETKNHNAMLLCAVMLELDNARTDGRPVDLPALIATWQHCGNDAAKLQQSFPGIATKWKEAWALVSKQEAKQVAPVAPAAVAKQAVSRPQIPSETKRNFYQSYSGEFVVPPSDIPPELTDPEVRRLYDEYWGLRAECKTAGVVSERMDKYQSKTLETKQTIAAFKKYADDVVAYREVIFPGISKNIEARLKNKPDKLARFKMTELFRDYGTSTIKATQVSAAVAPAIPTPVQSTKPSTTPKAVPPEHPRMPTLKYMNEYKKFDPSFAAPPVVKDLVIPLKDENMKSLNKRYKAVMAEFYYADTMGRLIGSNGEPMIDPANKLFESQKTRDKFGEYQAQLKKYTEYTCREVFSEVESKLKNKPDDLAAFKTSADYKRINDAFLNPEPTPTPKTAP